MPPDPTLHRLLAFDTMSPFELECVLRRACTLHRREPAAAGARPLRGKNLGLLCACRNDPDALLLRRAAEGLGAQVALVHPGDPDPSSQKQLHDTARLLGRLYDAVVCLHLAGSFVQWLRSNAGIPVYDGIAPWEGAVSRLASAFAPFDAAQDPRYLMLQAELLTRIG